MNNSSEFEVRVVVFREDSEWTAVALEMNVRGYGRTQKAAIDDVTRMLVAQVSFAVQMGHPESVSRPADPKYWDMYEEARKNEFVAKASGYSVPSDRLAADLVPLSLLAAENQSRGWTAGA